MNRTRSSQWRSARSSTRIANSNRIRLTRTANTSKMSRIRQTRCLCTITSWWMHRRLAKCILAARMTVPSSWELLRSSISNSSSSRMLLKPQVLWPTSWQKLKQMSLLSSTQQSRSRRRLGAPSMNGVAKIRHRAVGPSRSFCHGKSRTIYCRQVRDKARKDLSGSRLSQAIYAHI